MPDPQSSKFLYKISLPGLHLRLSLPFLSANPTCLHSLSGWHEFRFSSESSVKETAVFSLVLFSLVFIRRAIRPANPTWVPRVGFRNRRDRSPETRDLANGSDSWSKQPVTPIQLAGNHLGLATRFLRNDHLC